MTQAEKEIELLQCLEAYDRRFHEKLAKMPAYAPWQKNDRQRIRAVLRQTLGIRPEWIPQIQMQRVGILPMNGYSVEQLHFTSWKGVHGSAHLYWPDRQQGLLPGVLLCCGHEAGCKHAQSYQAMARRLARQGAAVLIADNMGQGERLPMGHSASVLPFACGMSLQGMLVMESIALLRWLAVQPKIDSARLGITGNSGGGALSMFVGALEEKVSLIVPCGYPSNFELFLRKNKVHCACNILPGILGRLEMWHVLSLCAPRRLRIVQGQGDHFFPYEAFCDLGQKLTFVYSVYGCREQFDCIAYPGGHGWDVARRESLSEFFSQEWGLFPAEHLTDDRLEVILNTVRCFFSYPVGALTVDEAACLISGKNPAKDLNLWDVYPPQFQMNAADLEGMQPRGAISSPIDYRQILAQYEACLSDMNPEI